MVTVQSKQKTTQTWNSVKWNIARTAIPECQFRPWKMGKKFLCLTGRGGGAKKTAADLRDHLHAFATCKGSLPIPKMQECDRIPNKGAFSTFLLPFANQSGHTVEQKFLALLKIPQWLRPIRTAQKAFSHQGFCCVVLAALANARCFCTAEIGQRR